jgi:peroxiredoxin
LALLVAQVIRYDRKARFVSARGNHDEETIAGHGGGLVCKRGVLTSFGNMTVASRQTFLINPEGQIAKHYEQVDPATHSQQVLGDLKSLM